MPTNKNAFIRYKYLDRLLSDRHHCYTIRDLTNKVNDMMERDGLKISVGIRTIQKDIDALQLTPFCAPIKVIKMDGTYVYGYSKSSFSLFTQELSREERNLLREVLSTIGQFDGLDNFQWLEDFKIGLGLEERRQIISFSNNPYLKNSNLLGTLFDNISNEVVIRLSYHTFTNPTVRAIDFHPYLLKQYNDRWFLLGAADSDGKILNFALDRIDKVEPLPEKKYKECPDDLYDRFEDIVGVTLYEDRPVEHILCWVSDAMKGYVDTKPIHGSQVRFPAGDQERLHKEYDAFEGYTFYGLKLKPNREFFNYIYQNGEDVLLVSPGTIREKMIEELESSLRKPSHL